jgi:hypothetical protein
LRKGEKAAEKVAENEKSIKNIKTLKGLLPSSFRVFSYSQKPLRGFLK